jgi:hypothetical protein
MSGNTGSGPFCERCQSSLTGGDRYLPYEAGNSPHAYTKCPSCGHKNIQYGFGGRLAVVSRARCGEPDQMWDKGDTFYCSRCAIRTDTSSGELSLRECPECGEQTDSKAAYCRQCNVWIAVDNSLRDSLVRRPLAARTPRWSRRGRSRWRTPPPAPSFHLFLLGLRPQRARAAFAGPWPDRGGNRPAGCWSDPVGAQRRAPAHHRPGSVGQGVRSGLGRSTDVQGGVTCESKRRVVPGSMRCQICRSSPRVGTPKASTGT